VDGEFDGTTAMTTDTRPWCWTSSTDAVNEVHGTFPTREAAIADATKNGDYPTAWLGRCDYVRPDERMDRIGVGIMHYLCDELTEEINGTVAAEWEVDADDVRKQNPSALADLELVLKEWVRIYLPRNYWVMALEPDPEAVNISQAVQQEANP